LSSASRSATSFRPVPGHRHAAKRLLDRQVNLPVAVLIWLMIIPMLLKIDFAALARSASTGAASASRCSSTGR
jgi:ACR3 family arsenite efflux pump ArsB